ncbi:hypothetical protein EBS67_00080 [bacterium]|nr:hypothetical protein [bacterium]NBT60660.1 hypothetical protein [Planctomycetia bacterium]
MARANNVVDAEFTMEETEVIASNPEATDEAMEYDQFVDVLADGKYGGEIWAEAEREKIRAQAEIRLSSKRNNEQRLNAATERLRKAVDDQKAVEEEFPSAQKWGKYYISLEAVNAKQAEANTP